MFDNWKPVAYLKLHRNLKIIQRLEERAAWNRKILTNLEM